jgi:hypothetical protein
MNPVLYDYKKLVVIPWAAAAACSVCEVVVALLLCLLGFALEEEPI